MKTVPLLSGVIFALASLFPSSSVAVDASTLTASAAYEHVQQLRKSAGRLVEKNPSTRDVETAIGLLQTALAYLDEDAVQDLSAGTSPLFYRELDVRLDLAAIYVQTSQVDLALTTLEQLKTRYWHPSLARAIAARKGLELLEHEPRMQALLKVHAIPRGLYGDKVLASDYKPTLSSAERAAGVSLFWNQARSDFVFFDNVENLDWGQTYLDFLKKVEATSSTEEYYRVLMQLAPLLRDGHTNIYPPKELASKFFARPPLRTELIENKVVVTRVDSRKLGAMVNVGDEIVEVDAIPVRAYAEVYVNPYVSSSTPQDRLVRQYSYQLLLGDEDKPVRLRLQSRAGAMREVVVPRKGYDDVVSPSRFDFRILPGNLAYISIDHFESDAAVKAFDGAFQRILGARALIIDVRNNGGGSTGYAQRILSYLTNEAMPAAYSYSRGDNGLSRNGSDAIEWRPLLDGRWPRRSGTRTNVFAGPVVLLTGPKTFSAAEDFVADFQTLARGKTIGSATAGSTGQPIWISLPGGGTARICAKRDTFADGTTFVGKGLTPDILVIPTLVDFYAGRDAVLERAIAELGAGPDFVWEDGGGRRR